MFRIPNFVRVDSKPFHPETYVGPEHEDDEGHSESVRDRGMSIKLKVENTLRWRWTKDEDGQDVSLVILAEYITPYSRTYLGRYPCLLTSSVGNQTRA